MGELIVLRAALKHGNIEPGIGGADEHQAQPQGVSGVVGVCATALLGSSWLSAAAAIEEIPRPISSVINAKVTTMDDAMPRAQAFAVRAGYFTAVGSTADIRGLGGPTTRTYDANGMMVTPGFIDAHNHGVGEQVLFGVNVGNPFVVEFVTIQSIIEKLKARAAKLPPGTWVEGAFYDDTKVKESAANQGRPRQGFDGPSRSCQSAGWPCQLFQFKGVRVGGDHQKHPQSIWWNV